MYLSRLIINPRSRQVQRELAEPYEMHRTLSRCFPAEYGAQERVLFRVDMRPRSETPIILVQSHEQPDWTFLEEPGAHAYLLAMDDESNPAIKTYQPHFNAGQVLAFRLCANPTVKRNGKRLGLYKEEEQCAWLERKAQAGGFRLLQMNNRQKAPIGGKLYRDGARHDLNLLRIQFDGVLQVVAPDLFIAGLEKGIGSGKGFGCGLLSLAAAG